MKLSGCFGRAVLAGLAWFAAWPAPSALFSATVVTDHGAVVRADTTRKELALIFTGGDYNDGGRHIAAVLQRMQVKAGFFFTGDFYRHPENDSLIRLLQQQGHYLGPHSDRHLLYCPWENRDSSLVSREQFRTDLLANYEAMRALGVRPRQRFFIPPYEWYNLDHVRWAAELDVTLFNYTPGVGTQADYTTPDMRAYRSSAALYQRLFEYEETAAHGLNGALLLIHIGTHPDRTDKFYRLLEPLIRELQHKGYRLVRIDSLLSSHRGVAR
ncbi:MAG: Polysaccharide deacetylase [bacterium ADurb.Bin478]|nr:MAG: Polysaccharide deacetylase [bacterium ADurb.Bin478]